MLTIKKDRLDLDYPALRKAAIALLGPKKANELITSGFKSNTGFLTLFAHMSHAVEYYRRNPNGDPIYPESELETPTPEDIASGKAITLAEAIRQFDAIQQTTAVEGYSQHLNYRVRSLPQQEAIFQNVLKLSTADNEDQVVEAQISLQSLQGFVQSAEATGKATATFKASPGIKESLKRHGVVLTWRDELQTRPELLRLQLGNQTHRAQTQAVAKNTSVREELLKIASETPGKTITLEKILEIEDVKELSPGNLQVTFKFPDIQRKLTKNAELSDNDPNKLANPGQGSLTDGDLRTHAVQSYGCNGRNLVSSSKEIAEALQNDLEKVAKTWLQKENLEPKDIQLFLEDYTVAALTAPGRFRPKTRLESLSRQSETPALESEGFLHARYTNDAATAIADKTKNVGKASPTELGGRELLDRLAEREINRSLYVAPSAKKDPFAELSSQLGISAEALAAQHRFVLESWYGIGEGAIERTSPNLSLQTYFLTEAEEEKLEEDREKWNQMRFEKGGTKIEDTEGQTREVREMEVGEWISQHGTIALDLPNEPALLHRLTRHTPRRDGLTAPRTRGVMDDTYMPRIGRFNAPLPRTLEDLLTPEGRAKFEEQLPNLSETAQKRIGDLRQLLRDWASGTRPLSPSSNNPLERRLLQWFRDVNKEIAAEKGGQLPEEPVRFQSIEELNAAFKPLARLGLFQRGAEAPLRTQNVPGRSTALPLKLLCGAGQEELATLHNDIELLEEMNNRWANALLANCFSNLPAQKETLWKELLKMDPTPQAILEHAVKMEASQTPNWTQLYWENKGLPNGGDSLPENLRYLSDLVGEPNQAPNTMTWAGEETPLTGIRSWLEDNYGIHIQLTEAELGKVDAAVLADVNEHLKKAEKAQELIEQTYEKLPNNIGQKVALTSTAGPENTADELGSALAAIDDILPANAKESEDLMVILLTEANPEIHLDINGNIGVATRNTQNIWRVRGIKGELAEAALEKIQIAEALLAKPESELDPADLTSRTNAQIRANNLLIRHNADKLAKALDILPTGYKTHGLCGELSRVMERSIQTLQATHQLKENLTFQLKDWQEDEPTPETGEVWNATATAVFDAKIQVDSLLERMTQNITLPGKPDILKLLITEEAKEAAITHLQNGNRRNAAEILETTIGNVLSDLETVEAEKIQNLRADLGKEIHETKETCKDTLEEIVSAENPVGKILRERHASRQLQEKIERTLTTERQTTLAQIEEAKRALRHTASPENKTQVEELEAKLRKIPSPEMPYRIAPVEIAILETQGELNVQTNKPWLSAWLQTPEGQESLSKRQNLAAWIKSEPGKETAKLGTLEAMAKLGLKTCEENILAGKPSQASNQLAKDLGEDLAALKVDENSPVSTTVLVAHSVALKTLQHLPGQFSEKAIHDAETEMPVQMDKNPIAVKAMPQTKGVRIASPYEELRVAREGGKAESRVENLPTHTVMNRVRRVTRIMAEPAVL